MPLVRVVVQDDLDLATVGRLRELLDDALRTHPERLVLDVSGCGFVDATALGMLLEVHRAARRQGAVLVLCRPSPRVTRILALTGLTGVFQVETADGPYDLSG